MSNLFVGTEAKDDWPRHNLTTCSTYNPGKRPSALGFNSMQHIPANFDQPLAYQKNKALLASWLGASKGMSSLGENGGMESTI